MIDEIRNDFTKLQDELLKGPIYPNVTPEEIRCYLASRYDFTKAMALDEVVADVDRMLRTWQVQVTHPRYFGLFNPSVTLASVIADTLVAMYNPQLASWQTSPAGNEIERHTLGWLAAKFGLPPNTLATFTNGGSEANLSAVIVALTRAFPDYGEDGLRCLAAAPAIYLTEESHHSFSKIAHMTGLGRKALRKVATTFHLTMDIADLEKRVTEDRKKRICPPHGDWHRRHDHRWRDRPVAGTGALLPGCGPVVSRGCRVGRGSRHFTDAAASSLWNRNCGFDHVRRA